MRQSALVFGLVLLFSTFPLMADGPGCEEVIDSRSYDDGGYDSWCWLSSMVCYYCWGANPDEYCADDWQPCEPTPRPKRPHPIVVQAQPRSLAPPPCAAKVLGPAPQQVKLEHVL